MDTEDWGLDDEDEVAEGVSGEGLDVASDLVEADAEQGRLVRGASRPDAKTDKGSPFVRAENEDDDGYDPYSDRPSPRSPLFERDPWS